MEQLGRTRKTRRKQDAGRWERGKRKRAKIRRPDMLVKYTDIPATEAMKEVAWLGKNFVPDRKHPNLVNVSVGQSRLVRNMRWDCYFQQQEQSEEGEDVESDSEIEVSVREKRILKDKTINTNLPRKWAPPAALRDFEAANSFNLTSPLNLRKIHQNTTPEIQAAIQDMQTLSKEREVVFQPTDKTGTIAMMPFKGYDMSIREILQETFENDEGEVKHKNPPSSAIKVKNEYMKIQGVSE